MADISLKSQVALLDRAELCVVGGGLAGVAAALTAAEAGVETVLVEERGALAWEISHGLELYLNSELKCPATLQRIVDALSTQNATRNGVLDPVATEVLCDRLLAAAKVRLHFRAFAGSYSSGLLRLTTKSGPLAIQAGAVVDATEESRLSQPASSIRSQGLQSRSFLLCAVTPPAAPETVSVDGLAEALVRPTLWPHEAHVRITWKTVSPDKLDSESRNAIARAIETLRMVKSDYATASLSLSAHEPFALSVPKLNAAQVGEKIFVAGPALLGRKPALEERAELGERAATRAIEELRGVAAR
jgi:hypothetical protein